MCQAHRMFLLWFVAGSPFTRYPCFIDILFFEKGVPYDSLAQREGPNKLLLQQKSRMPLAGLVYFLLMIQCSVVVHTIIMMILILIMIIIMICCRPVEQCRTFLHHSATCPDGILVGYRVGPVLKWYRYMFRTKCMTQHFFKILAVY